MWGNKDIAMDIVTYKKFLGQFSNPVTTAVETVSAEQKVLKDNAIRYMHLCLLVLPQDDGK